MKDNGKHQEISPRELNHWLENRNEFYLIDVLITDHYRKIHLPTALQACVFEVTFIEQIKAITGDKYANIVLYGSSNRTQAAVTAERKLAEEGYQNLFILRGGLEAWSAENYPLEGEKIDEVIDPKTILKLKDRLYIIDTEQSTIQWTGRNPNTSHFGNIKISKGDLSVTNEVITGDFEVDMDSITNINLEGDELQPVLIAHLKSDDFFLSKTFPKATFEILKGEPVVDPFLSIPNYQINGNLELKGIKAQQDFMATIAQTDDGLIIEAHFDVDRTKWEVTYGSTRFFEHLGMHMVFDPISIQLRIVSY